MAREKLVGIIGVRVSNKLILPVIIISQFCCTSLWFAGNGVIDNLAIHFDLKISALGHLTSAVQFGFIIGTLTFSILNIVDRFSPSKVFLISALLGSLFNLGIMWEGNNLNSLLSLRFFTGFFLAGIYPVGMKIAADYYEKGLGKALGFLVGALVVGTAFPHLLKNMTDTYPWEYVLIITSSLAVLGGLLMVIMVPDGPYRKPLQRADLVAFFSVFRNRNFRFVTFGYLGNTLGTKRTASIALLLSCVCCLISPLIFTSESESLFIGFLIFWGIVVIADSPLLSTLVAHNVSAEKKGTALTIVNCIGFSITIISIQFITGMIEWTNSNGIYTILAIGPVLGLIALTKAGELYPTKSKLH